MKTIISILAIVISTHSFAQESAPQAPAANNPSEKREEVVKKREELQEKRIEEGVKNGSLSPAETKRLEKQQNRIQKAENKAMADGSMSKQEFKKIEHMQNKANRNIYRKKHNDRH